jgi:DNA-directed RNA polymerase subunit beta'
VRRYNACGRKVDLSDLAYQELATGMDLTDGVGGLRRARWVVGPELRFDQCGVPWKLAWEMSGGEGEPRAAEWDERIAGRVVVGRRSPVWQRGDVRGFAVVPAEGPCVRMPALAVEAMRLGEVEEIALYMPRSAEGQARVRKRMTGREVLETGSGLPALVPTGEMVVGLHYLTMGRCGDGKRRAFGDMEQVVRAYEAGAAKMHEEIDMRLNGRQVMTPLGVVVRAEGRVRTTVGRVVFNAALPAGMVFYNMAMTAGWVERVAADGAARCGRAEMLPLADRLKALGFETLTRTGLSLAAPDLRVPARREEILAAQQRKCERIEKNRAMGAITARERYGAMVEIWSHARNSMAEEMDHTPATGTGNPDAAERWREANLIEVMKGSRAFEGTAKAGVALSGMYGLVRGVAGESAEHGAEAGEFSEHPVKGNFREGLEPLDYFRLCGDRRGALHEEWNARERGREILRKAAQACGRLVIGERDCGTREGLTKRPIYQGRQANPTLGQLITGRVSCGGLRHPATGEAIVHEGDLISERQAQEIEGLGIDRWKVRSPVTCRSRRGICAACYGVDVGTGEPVEEGMAVGMLAAQAVGVASARLGRRPEMRCFHVGGFGRPPGWYFIRVLETGRVTYRDLHVVETEVEGTRGWRVLNRGGSLAVMDGGRELWRTEVPCGAVMMVRDGYEARAAELVAMEPGHEELIVAEHDGRVVLEDVIVGDTARWDDATSPRRLEIREHEGLRHPLVKLVDGEGRVRARYFVAAQSRLEVAEGAAVNVGQVLACRPRPAGYISTARRGIAGVEELLEARRPKDAAALAEWSGRVEIEVDRIERKIAILIRSREGRVARVEPAPGLMLRVHSGEWVERGECLVEGAADVAEVLRLRGVGATCDYVLRELRDIWALQNVTVEEKHGEVILRQMVGKVRVVEGGDTGWAAGQLVERWEAEGRNAAVVEVIRGISELAAG